MRRRADRRDGTAGALPRVAACAAALVWPVGAVHAAAPGSPAPIDLAVPPPQDETITVMGHRPYVLAPLPGGRSADPAAPGIGPGTRLGPFSVTGGASNGAVSAGLALPIRAVKGLEFDAGVSGSRDALSPVGTTAAAAATAGFRLRF